MLPVIPTPSRRKAIPIAVALAIATLAACVDEPMSPTFDTLQDMPPTLVRAPYRIDPVDLSRLEWEAELGRPSSAGEQAPGTVPWPGDDEADWIATGHRTPPPVVPAKIVSAQRDPSTPPAARQAASPRRRI